MTLFVKSLLPLGHKAERSPIVSSFFINVLLFCVVYALFIPAYETNDDVNMSMISAGLGRGYAPSEYMVHINVLIGLSLKYLTEISNSIPWYGLFLILSLYLAHLSIAYVFFKTFSFAKALIFYCAFFMVGSMIILLSLEFTTVSLVVGSAAYFYFFHAGYQDKSAPRPLSASVIRYLPTIGLVSLSALIRWKSFLLMTLVAMPVFLLVFHSLRRDRRKLLGAVLGLTLAVFCSFGTRYFHTVYYDRGEWKGVLKHIALRGEFTDYNLASSTAEDKAVFDHVGWSENDFKMFRWRFCADDKLYSLENLEYIVSNIHKHRSFSISYVSSYLKGIWNDDRGRILLLASAAALPFLFINASCLLLIACTYAFIAGSAGYMSVFMKTPPPWVFLGTTFYLFLLSFFTGMFILADEGVYLTKRSPRARKFLAVLATVLWAGLAHASVDISWQRSALAAKHNAELEDLVKGLNPRQDQLYVIWGPCFPYEYINPLKNLLLFKDFNSLGIGNFINTPISKEILRRSGIADIYTGLLRQDVFMFISSDRLYFLDYYKKYMLEHYNTSVDYKVLSVKGPYVLIKFEKNIT